MSDFYRFKTGVNLGVLSTDPVTSDSGDIYYNSTENRYKYYDGTDWNELLSPADIYTKANDTLDNLSTTAVNASIIPAVTNTSDLGSSILAWKDNYSINTHSAKVNVYQSGLYTNKIIELGYTTIPSTYSYLSALLGIDFVLETQGTQSDNSGQISIKTAPPTASGISGDVNISTGGGLVNSGNINIQTGSASGTRGAVVLDGSSISVSNRQIQNLLDPTAAQHAATKNYVDTEISALPTPMVYVGTWDAATNTPTLSNGTGTQGHLYQVTVAGTVDFGAGNITFAIGDKCVYNGTVWEKWDNTDDVLSVNGQTGIVVLTTTNINEGTNLYYTDSRARTAAVVNTLAGSETDQAPSVQSVNNALSGKANTSLDNLNATAVNVDILPDTTATIDLGSSTLSFNNAYNVEEHTTKVNIYSDNTFTTIAGDIDYSSGIWVTSSNLNNPIIIRTTGVDGSGNSGEVFVSAGSPTGTGTGGDVNISTGVSGGTGDTGDINLTTGTTSGIRGEVNISARRINVNNVNIINVTDPVSAQDAATKNYVDTQAFTTEMAQDAVGSILDDGTVGSIVFTYNDVTPKISAVIEDNGVTSPKLAQNLLLRGEVERGSTTSAAIRLIYADTIGMSPLASNVVITAFTRSYLTASAVQIDYVIREDNTTAMRVGTFRVVTNGTSISYSDTYTETASIPITLDAVINGSNINIRYSSGSNPATMRADQKVFRNF